jgi:hypothetical protein
VTAVRFQVNIGDAGLVRLPALVWALSCAELVHICVCVRLSCFSICLCANQCSFVSDVVLSSRVLHSLPLLRPTARNTKTWRCPLLSVRARVWGSSWEVYLSLLLRSSPRHHLTEQAIMASRAPNVVTVAEP